MWRTPPDAPLRRRVAAGALVVAVITLGWTTLLLATGGFDAKILGFTIRAHDATRPAVPGVVALTLFVWAYGARRLLARQTRALRAIAFALSAAVLIFGLRWGTGVAGGSDSYGYISQAELWLHGLPIVPQPWTADVPWPNGDWTFTPLGYRPADWRNAIVPSYAVGLPLLMAAMKFVAGQGAIFVITPVAGAVLVLVTYAVGRRLGSSLTGLMAAWLVATNTTLLGEVTAPMSDVLAGAALAGSCYFLLSPGPRACVAAGLAASLALLVRPNLAPTLAVMMLWLGLRHPPGDRPRWRAQLGQAMIFAVAASPGFLVPAWANWRLYGSPFVSGYGNLESIYHWSNLLPNLHRYSTLLIESRAALMLAGFAALLIPARRLWPDVTDRSVLIGIALFVFSLVLQYLVYQPATGGGYLRLLLPCWPFVMVGVAQVALLFTRPWWLGAVVGLAIVAYGASNVHRLSDQGEFIARRSEHRYPAAAALARVRTDPRSVIFASQHGGSVRYYAGRMTVRYDLLESAWLDRSVAWLAAHGAHPYALLDDGEVKDFRRRFAGQQRVVQLDEPVFIYKGVESVYFYDLMRSSGEHRPVEWIADRFDGPRYPAPASMPQFGFTPTDSRMP